MLLTLDSIEEWRQRETDRVRCLSRMHIAMLQQTIPPGPEQDDAVAQEECRAMGQVMTLERLASAKQELVDDLEQADSPAMVCEVCRCVLADAFDDDHVFVQEFWGCSEDDAQRICNARFRHCQVMDIFTIDRRVGDNMIVVALRSPS